MRKISARKMAALQRRVEKVEEKLWQQRIKERGFFVAYREDDQYWVQHPDPENRYREVKEFLTFPEIERRANESGQVILMVHYTSDAEE